MKFISLVPVLAAAAAVVQSAPTPIEKREIGGVLICNGANATGPCDYQVYQLETCYNMTAPFYQNAATFAPDGEAFYCYPYIMPCGGICTSPTGCTVGAVSYNSTSKFNLADLGGWDHYIASFDCHAGVAESS